MAKTILKLHANGDFETVGTQLIQSQIANNYSFTNSTITVPEIIEYSTTALGDMPAWVRDTGQPISFFEEGIVIKGDLIHTEQEPPESDVLFMDDFNRADSNTLGDNWIDGRGSWGIENNMVKPTNSNNIALCVHPHGDNVSISSDVKRIKSDGVIFRGKDANNHLYVQFEQADLKLKLLINGIVTTLQTFNLNSVVNQIYRVRIELRGIEIKIFVDDVLRITHETDVYLNDNLCGFQSWSDYGTHGRFDNFIMEKLPINE